jgi:hypothetical protein
VNAWDEANLTVYETMHMTTSELLELLDTEQLYAGHQAQLGVVLRMLVTQWDDTLIELNATKDELDAIKRELAASAGDVEDVDDVTLYRGL